MFEDVEEIGLAERGKRRQKMGIREWGGILGCWGVVAEKRPGSRALEIGALPVSRQPQSYITDLLSNYLLVFSIEGT